MTQILLLCLEPQIGEFIGHIDGFLFEDNPKIVEIGIILLRRHHGKGFAYEALKAFIDYYLSGCQDIQEVMATAHPENKASIKLIEKLGMQFEMQLTRFGQLRNQYFLKSTLKDLVWSGGTFRSVGPKNHY